LKAGLRRAVISEVSDCFWQCLNWISEDGKAVPKEQLEWRIGQTFSWHYVKIVEYRANQFFYRLEMMAMATKGKKASKNASFGDYQFVRCELSSEDKKAAKVWIEENAAHSGEVIHDIVASDYKFSLSFSSEHDTFTACLVGKPDNVHNPQKTLTARHKDWVTAMMTVAFKHNVMFKGTIWESDDAGEDDGWA
jgi:hypothetical protein